MVTKKTKADIQSGPDTESETHIIDVARPGSSTPADPTSRPVIVSNRVVIQDPMVTASAASAGPSGPPDLGMQEKESPASSKLRTKMVIQPLAEKTPEADTSADKPSAKADNDTDGMIDVRRGSPALATEEPAKPAAPAASTTSDTPPDDSPPGTPDAIPSVNKDNEEAALLEADAKAQDEIDTLVEQKTYFLPINSVEQRRSRRIVLLGFVIILLLGLAWLDIALDAGLIHISGIKPVTHLFQN